MGKKMKQFLITFKRIADTMEREPISKNRVSPKNGRSRNNKKTMLLASLLFMAFIMPNSTFAQFFGPPSTSVLLNHPPNLGLKVNKIVFNQATGECADQIVNELISLFVSNNVEVIDRDNLTAILREQNFSWSGYVDQSTALSIGKIIGPSAMITAKVLVCQSSLTRSYKDHERSEKDKSGKVRKWMERMHYSTLKVNIKVSLQTVDLTTGRIFAAKIFDASQSETTQAEGGEPVPPDEYQLKEKAFLSLTKEVEPLFFPWTETVTVAFFKDKIDRKGSKSAWDALKVSNYQGAIDLAMQYLEWCEDVNNFTNKKGKVDEKDRVESLSHAYYNCGVMCFILNDYDTALQYLKKAQEFMPADKYIADAINDCNKAKSLTEANQRIDNRNAAEIAKSEQQVAQAQQQAAAKILKNADIIALTKSKLSKSIIIQKIKAEQCNFDTSTNALIELSKAGVDDEVISIMVAK
jgi:tetratricopeptide (TPR) repeat protein